MLRPGGARLSPKRWELASGLLSSLVGRALCPPPGGRPPQWWGGPCARPRWAGDKPRPNFTSGQAPAFTAWSVTLRYVRVIAVPVKSLARAKSRLGPVLAPLERAALTLAMLEDVLDATLAVPGSETWVVSPDEAVLEIAARRGARPVIEERPPLAAAIRQAEQEAEARGADMLAVVPADLPLLSSAALADALHTLGPVVLAPSADRGGTNLLLRRPPKSMPARFGPDSFRKHVEGARARDLPVSVVEWPELTFDVDVPEDFKRVLMEARPGRTLESCRELDVAGRLLTRT
jgi:2-phospho-L-lactate/phosphoenolpyruvate guanylyltransferase